MPSAAVYVASLWQPDPGLPDGRLHTRPRLPLSGDQSFLRQLHPEIVAQTEARIAAIGGTVVRDPATDILRVNDEFSVSLVLARCQTHDSGSHRWKVRFDTSLCPDITVAVRLDHANHRSHWTTTCCPGWISDNPASAWPTTMPSSSTAIGSTPGLPLRHGRTLTTQEGSMTPKHRTSEVRMIPIDRIDVLNPRDRNKRVFDEIVGNIKAIGLKKPITVTPRTGADGAERFLLVCGEGRLNAFRSLGEATIPALVVDVNDEDAFIMSLAENIARRQCRPLECWPASNNCATGVQTRKRSPRRRASPPRLRRRHPDPTQQGEERLLIAVEKGSVPLNAALSIVGAGERRQGYAGGAAGSLRNGKLRGKQLMEVRTHHRAPADPGALRRSSNAAQNGSGRHHVQSRPHLPKGSRAAEDHRQEGRICPAAIAVRGQKPCASSSPMRISSTCCAPKGWIHCRSISLTGSGPEGARHDSNAPWLCS
jgi:hypothetical protein